jgi:hypothetical protein
MWLEQPYQYAGFARSWLQNRWNLKKKRKTEREENR